MRRANWASLITGLLIVHTLVLAFSRFRMALSDLLLDLLAFIVAAICLRRSSRCSGPARWKWILFSAGIFIWALGQACNTYNEDVLNLQQAATAVNSDFYFFLFGIPLLLAISSANERQRHAPLLWIDGLQALFAIYLVHLQIFPGVTGSAAEDAISALRMTHAYNAENSMLAIAAGLRLFASPRGEEKKLYRVLFLFLAPYAVIAAYLNHLALSDNLQTGTFWDLAWDLPFAVVALVVSRMPVQDEPEALPDQTWSGLLVTNASPVFFTMALLIMGVYVGHQRPLAGLAAVTFALVSYAMRSSFTQSHAMRAERKLLESEAALRAANHQLEQLSFVDRLTGVANRRRFEDALAVEQERARRTAQPLSLLVVDIDHFKLLNDTYGHQHGDDCLIATSHALRARLEAQDQMLARYGGEEFVAILPNYDAAAAFALAEQMRTAIGNLEIQNKNAPLGSMTVSIGVAISTGDHLLDTTELFSSADRALYQAKSRGRNRVEVFEAVIT